MKKKLIKNIIFLCLVVLLVIPAEVFSSDILEDVVSNIQRSIGTEEKNCYAASHVHTDKCYCGATKHSHSSSCYREEYGECGTFYEEKYQLVSYDSVHEYYYCSDCGRTDYSSYTIYYDDGGNSYRSGFSTTAYDYCWKCGGEMVYDYTETRSWSTSGKSQYGTGVYYCDSCGHSTTNAYDGESHWDYIEVLSCGKESGVYYNSNGTKAACVCDKTIISASVNTEQRLAIGQTPNTTASVSLLNGESKNTQFSMSGFSPYVYNTWQTVTLTAPSEYPYSNKGGSGTTSSTRYTATIRVFIEGSFKLLSEVTGNGAVVIDGNNATSLEVIGGQTISVYPQAKAGSHLESLYFNDICLFTNTGGNENPTIPASFYTITMPSSNSKIKALFVGDVCKIYFEFCDGSAPVMIEVPYGRTLSFQREFPADPVREGSLFLGWFTDASGGSMISRSTIAQGNATYYARWASDEGDVLQLGFEEKYPMLEPMPISGFTADSDFWHKDIVKENGSGAVMGEYLLDAYEHAWYGRWIPNRYKITILGNGGDFERSEVVGISDHSSDGAMDFISSSEVDKEVLYHAPLGELPLPYNSEKSFSGYVTSDGVSFSSLPSSVYSVATDITIKADWLSHSFVPDEDAFRLSNVSVHDAEGEYDISSGIPSTESLLVEGNVSPFFVSWNATTNANGKVKIGAVYLYAIQNITFSLKDASGQEGLTNNEYAFDFFCREKYFSDRIEYTTSDGKISIITYYSSDVDDIITVEGSAINALASSRYSSPSNEHFEVFLPINIDTQNGNYSMYYSIEFDKIN